MNNTEFSKENYKMQKIMYIQIAQIIVEFLLIIQRYVSDFNYITLILFIILFILVISNSFEVIKNKYKLKYTIYNLVCWIEMVILIIFIVQVYATKDLSEFVKNCDQTVGTIVDIKEDEKVMSTLSYDNNEEKVSNHYYGVKTYNYTFEYYVGTNQYKETFKREKRTITVDSWGEAKRRLERIKPEYNNDKITLYYNIDNPSDYRLNINFFDDSKLNIFMAIILGILVIKLLFIIKEFNSIKKI